MTPIDALIQQFEYGRMRLLKTLSDIEALPVADELLHWRMPFGKGRAHIGWQMMHCAATLDRYLNVRILEKDPVDSHLVTNYAGGSNPDDQVRITPDQIRSALAATAPPFLSYFRALSEDRLSQKPHERADRTHVEIFHLLTWHEAHHQGQCHLAMNCFMAGR